MINGPKTKSNSYKFTPYQTVRLKLSGSLIGSSVRKNRFVRSIATEPQHTQPYLA